MEYFLSKNIISKTRNFSVSDLSSQTSTTIRRTDFSFLHDSKLTQPCLQTTSKKNETDWMEPTLFPGIGAVQK